MASRRTRNAVPPAGRAITPSKSSLSVSDSSNRTALELGGDLFLTALKTAVLPAIINYYNDTYDVESSVEEVAQGAFGFVVPDVGLATNHSSSTPATKENSSRKPKQIDIVNGCQYILERSRNRKNEPCGEKREGTSLFCKNCKKKKQFPAKAMKLAEERGMTFEEIAGSDVSPPDKSETKKPTSRKAPSTRSRAAEAPISRPGGHPRAPERNVREQPVEEELTLNGTVIEDLDDILYDPNSNIVFYCVDDESDIIAFGQWTEDGKIARMTEALRLTAKQYGMQIGEYTDYDIGNYSVDVVDAKEDAEEDADEDAKDDENIKEDGDADEDEDAKEEDAKGEETKGEAKEDAKEKEEEAKEERLHAIPQRRSLRRGLNKA